MKGILSQYSAEQRVLLHLNEFQIGRNVWDAPAETTQSGIAAAIFVQRKHISRTLKRLQEKQMITFEIRHVIGDKQRKRTYELTMEGHAFTRSMIKNIESTVIQIEGRNISFGECFPNSIDILTKLSHIDEELIYHENPLISPVSKAKGELSTDGKHVEKLIRRLFSRAWEDGKITNDEQNLLNEVVHFWGIHPERVQKISEETRGKVDAPHPEEIYLEMLGQALEDGEIQQEELGLLETMREAFGISIHSHEKLLIIAQEKMLENPFIDIYKEALKTALEDNVITADEQAMLETLQDQLNISKEQHDEIMNMIRE